MVLSARTTFGQARIGEEAANQDAHISSVVHEKSKDELERFGMLVRPKILPVKARR